MPRIHAPETRWFDDFAIGETFYIPSRTMTDALSINSPESGFENGLKAVRPSSARDFNAAPSASEDIVGFENQDTGP